MKLLKGTRIALKTLFIHKVRTGLATLGIVIGVCSVIVMVAIGDGAERQVLAKIQAMGTDLVMVTAGQVRIIAGRPRQTGNVASLTLKDLRALAEEARSIKNLAPAQGRKMLVKHGALSTTTTITGTSNGGGQGAGPRQGKVLHRGGGSRQTAGRGNRRQRRPKSFC